MDTLSSLHSREPVMNLGPIRAVLGDDMPDITPTPLGRLRLVSALRNKFGASYRNIPQAYRALQYFDREMAFFQKLRALKGAQNGNSSR